MAKLYFNKLDEDGMCYTMDYYKLMMAEEGIEEMVLEEARTVDDSKLFFCRAVCQVGEKGDCGRVCPYYEPCNRKSGNCRHNGKLHEGTGRIVTVKQR